MRNYIRKTNIKSWEECYVKEALKDILEKKFSFAKASEKYQIPASTLKTRWKRMLEAGGLDQVKFLQLGEYRPTFSEDQEKELVEHIRIMDSKFFGLTRNELRRVAFQFAEDLGIPHNFNKTIGLAGSDWYRKFMNRHPELSLRTPENTSFARATGFNKVVTNKFFELLGELMTEFKFPPHNIWNVDETATSVVPKKQPKVVSLKGKHQVGMITSAERGITVTAAICCNAAGEFIPPLLIYPRVKYNPKFAENCPPGTQIVCHPSGWMQTDIFYPTWFEHFLTYAKPSKENPVLIILDGHACHTKNLNFLLAARQNHVHILCLSPHTSHKLQPLDRSFMKSFSSFHSGSVLRWLRAHPGQVLTLQDVSHVFGESYLEAATPKNAISGFRAAGIYPFNRNIFTEEEFSPASTTDIEMTPQDSQASEEITVNEETAKIRNDVQPVVERENVFMCSENSPCQQHLKRLDAQVSNLKDEVQHLWAQVLMKEVTYATGHHHLSESVIVPSQKSSQVDDTPKDIRGVLSDTISFSKSGKREHHLTESVIVPSQKSSQLHDTPKDLRGVLSDTISFSKSGKREHHLTESVIVPSQESSQADDKPKRLRGVLTEIIQIPKAQYANNTRKASKNRGETVILTTCSYIEKLKEANKNIKIKSEPKTKRSTKKEAANLKKSEPKAKIKTEKEAASDEKSSKSKNGLRSTKKLTQFKRPKSKKIVLKVEEAENEDVLCPGCASSYTESLPGETWIQCQSCKSWYHEACVYLPKKAVSFICQNCAKV